MGNIFDKLKDVDLSNIEITIPDKDDIKEYIEKISSGVKRKGSGRLENGILFVEDDEGKEKKNVKKHPFINNINIKNIHINNRTKKTKQEEKEPEPLTPEETLGKSQRQFKKNYKHRVIRFNLYTEAIFIATIILALFIGIKCISFGKISGNGMNPSIEEGEYVAVNKLAYLKRNPERGDIIESGGQIYRVIGIPGDKVEINSGKLFLNGKKAEESYEQDDLWYPKGDVDSSMLKENEYCLMRDNRLCIDDSRQFGMVDKNAITGKVFMRF